MDNLTSATSIPLLSATDIPKQWKRINISVGSYLFNVVSKAIKMPQANSEEDKDMTIKINHGQYKGTYRIGFNIQDDNKDIIGLELYESLD